MGGQSIYDFEYGLAPYVAKSYVTEVVNHVEDIFEEFDTPEGKKKLSVLRQDLKTYLKDNTLIMNTAGKTFIASKIRDLLTDISEKQLNRIFNKVELAVDRLTYQAMEAIIHNLNTMQARAGLSGSRFAWKHAL